MSAAHGAPLVDAAGWPVVVVSGEGRHDADDTRAALAELTALLRRAEAAGERLGLVFDTDRLDRDARAVAQEWMAANFELLGNVVVASGTVVAPVTVAANRKLIEEHAAMYPFAAWCAATAGECREWVAAKLAEEAA